MRRLALLFVAVVWLAGGPSSLPGQSIDGARAGVSARLAAPDSAGRASGFTVPAAPMSARRGASLASFLVPGSGQYLLGNDRFVAYLAVELLGWWKYSKDVAERAERERDFKDLSRRVARANFSTTFPDADWAYYEWMRDDIESGQFSMSTSGPTVPDTNTSTYNGKRWAIAQGTQPTHEAALAQYEREAIRPEFRWSWRSAQLQYDQYRRMTDRRNDAARAAVKDLLVIGANHFLSMIDAFSTLRLQARTRDDGRTSVGATLRW